MKLETTSTNGTMSFTHAAPEHAEEILAGGRAELVILGRVLLFNPHWPLHAANTLRAKDVPWPVQYERANIY